MKLKKLLTKTLLVAALLSVGVNGVWAAEPTLTLTSSYAVENYSKLCYLEFGAKTIDDGSTYADVVNVGGYTESSTRGIQNQTSSSSTTPITITKSIKKGDLIVMQAGQTATYGMSITVGSAVSNPIKNDGYYVYYVTSNAESFTINLARLNYVRALLILRPSTTNYVVNAVKSDGTFLKELKTGTYTADETVYYPYGIMKDGVCYSKVKNGSEPFWGFTNIAAGLRTIVYTANTWAYYSEMEDMNGASLGGTRYTLPGRSSNGNWKWMNKNARMYSSGLSAGTYSITVYGRNSKSSAQTPPVIILRSPTGSYTGTVATFGSWSASNTGEYTATNVIIPEDGFAFCLYQVDYNSNIDLDYVYAVKTSDDVTVSATITDCGWSTFACNYALDLSTITGGTAYYASAASGSTVTLTTTDATVPAGEGIMVKGTAGETFTIGVAASGTAISGNLLKGQTTTGNVAASTSGAYHYVFGFNTADASIYGFYNLNADTEVAAGKAYLETTEALSPSAARIAIVFDDETTGVSDVRSKMSDVRSEYYNLNGQRVEKPSKGLYIVNGKKVIIK